MKDKIEKKKSIKKDLKKWFKLTCQTPTKIIRLRKPYGKQIETNYKFQSPINLMLKLKIKKKEIN
jgi:hypothetical protein